MRLPALIGTGLLVLSAIVIADAQERRKPSPAPAPRQPPPHPGPSPTSGQGPYFHQVMSATSKDGLAWTHDGRVLLDHASVPSAIVTPQGRVRLYYVDASSAPENVNCAESSDQGRTFTVMGARSPIAAGSKRSIRASYCCRTAGTDSTTTAPMDRIRPRPVSMRSTRPPPTMGSNS